MLNELYEKLEAVLDGLDTGGEQSRAFEGEIVLLKEMLGYPGPVQDEWDEIQRREILAQKLRRLAVVAEGILIPLPKNPVAQWFDGTYQDAKIDMVFDEVDLADLLRFVVEAGVSYDAEDSDGLELKNRKRLDLGSAAALRDACKTLLSYTTDLLYRLDDQVNLDEIEEIRQAKAAIAQVESADTSVQPQQAEMTLKELSPGTQPARITVHLLCEHGKLWIRPQGYGDAGSLDGLGFPIALELWQNRLRLVVFSDIDIEEPQIIDLENAKESCRLKDDPETSRNTP